MDSRLQWYGKLEKNIDSEKLFSLQCFVRYRPQVTSSIKKLFEQSSCDCVKQLVDSSFMNSDSQKCFFRLISSTLFVSIYLWRSHDYRAQVRSRRSVSPLLLDGHRLPYPLAATKMEQPVLLYQIKKSVSEGSRESWWPLPRLDFRRNYRDLNPQPCGCESGLSSIRASRARFTGKF